MATVLEKNKEIKAAIVAAYPDLKLSDSEFLNAADVLACKDIMYLKGMRLVDFQNNLVYNTNSILEVLGEASTEEPTDPEDEEPPVDPKPPVDPEEPTDPEDEGEI